MFVRDCRWGTLCTHLELCNLDYWSIALHPVSSWAAQHQDILGNSAKELQPAYMTLKVPAHPDKVGTFCTKVVVDNQNQHCIVHSLEVHLKTHPVAEQEKLHPKAH